MWPDAFRVVSSEWLKLRRSRATPVGLLVYLLVLALLYVGYAVAARQSFLGIESGFYLSGAVCSGAATPLAFVAVLVVAFAVGREFSQGTIQMVWSRPLARSGWLLGKTVSCTAHLSVFVLVTVLLTVTAAGIEPGFADLMEKNYRIHTASSLWWGFLLAAVLLWLAVVAVAVVAMVPALLIASPGGAIAVSLVFGFVLQLAAGWETLNPFVLPAYLTAPFDQFVAMAKGLPLPETWGGLVRHCLIGSLAWLAAGWFASWWIVRRKEVLH